MLYMAADPLPALPRRGGLELPGGIHADGKPASFLQGRAIPETDGVLPPAIGFLLGLININLKYTLLIGGAAVLLPTGS